MWRPRCRSFRTLWSIYDCVNSVDTKEMDDGCLPLRVPLTTSWDGKIELIIPQISAAVDYLHDHLFASDWS
jgi:hypothetical protein